MENKCFGNYAVIGVVWIVYFKMYYFNLGTGIECISEV